MKKMNFRFVYKFTLLELLLVISVIIILASLLLPALQTAKNKARTSLCSGNLKQIITSSLFYTADYGGNFLVGSFTAVQMMVYPDILSEGGYLTSNSSVINCPSQSRSTSNKCFVYGANMSMERLPCPSSFTWYCCYPLYKSKQPSSETLFGDSIFRAGSSYFPNQCYRYWTSSLTPDGGIYLGHPGKIANMAFIDGHVEGCNDKKLNNINIIAYIDKNYSEYN